MPQQNRVTPTGEIIATAARGSFMGNRGVIHDADEPTSLKRRWGHQRWICCALKIPGKSPNPQRPRAYTKLFFLD